MSLSSNYPWRLGSTMFLNGAWSLEMPIYTEKDLEPQSAGTQTTTLNNWFTQCILWLMLNHPGIRSVLSFVGSRPNQALPCRAG